jgi:hypothetical protein
MSTFCKYFNMNAQMARRTAHAPNSVKDIYEGVPYAKTLDKLGLG